MAMPMNETANMRKFMRSLGDTGPLATRSSVMATTASEYAIQIANGGTKLDSFVNIGWYGPAPMRHKPTIRNRHGIYERDTLTCSLRVRGHLWVRAQRER